MRIGVPLETRPGETRVAATPETVKNKFGVLAENFILYKTLMGDTSDKVGKVKGLGAKGVLKKFPELGMNKLSDLRPRSPRHNVFQLVC